MGTTSLVLSFLLPQVHAFCGTYVGTPGEQLTNTSSQLVVVKSPEGRTTLTMTNNYQGDLADFAVVIPVPATLEATDVRLAEGSAVSEVDRYSGARLVSYTCEDLDRSAALTPGPVALTLAACTASYDMSGLALGGTAEDSVAVDTEFALGDYELAILTAEESTGLMDWLDLNGFGVDASAESLLQEYIDAGSRFLTARVGLEALIDGGDNTLAPIQIAYDSVDALTIPVRLGTLNSAGVQDLTLYVIGDSTEGAWSIANYPQATLDEECLWEDTGDSFAAFYEDRVDTAIADAGGTAWIAEYGWMAPISSCDPCPTAHQSGMAAALDPAALDMLAWHPDIAESDPSWAQWWSSYLTRIQFQYRADDVVGDLQLYPTNISDNFQARYIQHLWELESAFPVCGEGWREDPGTCWLPARKAREARENLGCSAAGAVGAPLLALLGLLAVGRRRA